MHEKLHAKKKYAATAYVNLVKTQFPTGSERNVYVSLHFVKLNVYTPEV